MRPRVGLGKPGWGVCFGLALAFAGAGSAHAGQIVIVNGDGPGEGLNDSTPWGSEGGNTATTLGEARLRAVEFASSLWANALDSSVPIEVTVRFDPMGGTATSAVLGNGGTTALYRDFLGAPLPSTWYPAALANRLAGEDLDAGTASEITAVFNSDVDAPVVLGASGFYYGFDRGAPEGDVSFITVFTHELTHGLGFQDYLDGTGAKFLGLDDAFIRYLERTGAVPPDFPSMTNAQRYAAFTAAPDIHWVGPNVAAASSQLVAGVGPGGSAEMYAPGPPVSGAALSHFNTTLQPDQIMEPFYLDFALDLRLTQALLADIGWATTSCAGSPNADAVVWVDDSLPRGAAPSGNAEGWSWTSDNPAPFFGSFAHSSNLVAGMHQHYFSGAGATALAVSAGDSLFAYVYLDPANPPREVMLQWNDGYSWEHRAYWGENLLAWGTDGTSSRRSMGPLPPAGQWQRLEVPAALVGLEGRTLNGMAFTLYDGKATWDVAGLVPAASGTPGPILGRLAHQSGLATALHQHYFYGATTTLTLGSGDKLYAWIFLDAANPPREVMLQWNDGSWEHRAYWGENLIASGTDGTSSRYAMGPLPVAGKWVRLEVPASTVALEGRTLNGMAFALYGGRATWDDAGRIASGGSTTAWLSDEIPAGAVAWADNELWRWVGRVP